MRATLKKIKKKGLLSEFNIRLEYLSCMPFTKFFFNLTQRNVSFDIRLSL